MAGVGFVFPALVLFSVFTVYPMFKGVALSFYDAGIRTITFVGLGNYAEALSCPVFRKAFLNTFKFVCVCLPPLVVLPLVIAAVANNAGKRVRVFVRFAYYLPTLTAGTVAAMIWRWLFHPMYGLINSIIMGLGGPRVMWLSQNPTAMWAIAIVMVASGMGVSVMIYMAAMASIERSLYESARIDGCGKFGEFRHVTLPAVLPVLAFLVIVKTIGTLQVWQYVWMMTGGGPFYGTTTLLYLVYEQGILSARYGYASTVAVILGVITVAFAVVQYRFFTRRQG